MKKIAKLIETKRFSNKNFRIEIELYEHGLAKGRMECKRRGVEEKMGYYNSPFLYFTGYHWITIMEWNEFYASFAGDKIARRWVRRVMHHCLDGFLRLDGTIDSIKVAIEDDRRNAKSREYYKMNTRQLREMKRLLPGFFAAGTFRTGMYKYTKQVLNASSKVGCDVVSPKTLGHPVGYRKFLQGRADTRKMYVPLEQFKGFLREFDSQFYAQVCRERTMDDCHMWLEYRFPQGEIPEMRIFVQDNEYDEFEFTYDE